MTKFDIFLFLNFEFEFFFLNQIYKYYLEILSLNIEQGSPQENFFGDKAFQEDIILKIFYRNWIFTYILLIFFNPGGHASPCQPLGTTPDIERCGTFGLSCFQIIGLHSNTIYIFSVVLRIT